MSSGDIGQRSRRFVRKQFSKEKDREQVAAVCYRMGRNGIEFLLVLTRSGRWTFPKGGLEPGMTHAQVAAMEAFEEAGVHGRLEHLPFARYFRGRGKKTEPGERELRVHAHLCEVSRQEAPQELNRRPTWFPAEKAKKRLREDRESVDGESMVQVVDRAVARIVRLRSMQEHSRRDSLQRVKFEALELFMDPRLRVERENSAGKRRNKFSRLLLGNSGVEADTSRATDNQVIEINEVRSFTKSKRGFTSPRS